MHRYHARDASTILEEQEAQRLAESMEEEDTQYEYEYENRQCRPCGQGDNPRFFFGTHQEEDMNDVPCCSEDEDDMEVPRMKNASQCGKKSLNRILGGVVTQDNEFPWHCALLNTDQSFFGCSAVLLSCEPLILATAAHCFVQ